MDVFRERLRSSTAEDVYMKRSYLLGSVFRVSKCNPSQVQCCAWSVATSSAAGPVQTDANHVLVCRDAEPGSPGKKAVRVIHECRCHIKRSTPTEHMVGYVNKALKA